MRGGDPAAQIAIDPDGHLRRDSEARCSRLMRSANKHTQLTEGFRPNSVLRLSRFLLASVIQMRLLGANEMMILLSMVVFQQDQSGVLCRTQ